MAGLGVGPDLIAVNPDRTAIRSFGDQCFMVNNVLVNQSVLLFPNSFLAWSARTMADVTKESLEVFTLMYPTLEVLFIGCGEKMEDRFSEDIREHFRKQGIVVEALDTINAAATFNVLNSEGRNVAAALLTLQPADIEDAYDEDEEDLKRL